MTELLRSRLRGISKFELETRLKRVSNASQTRLKRVSNASQTRLKHVSNTSQTRLKRVSNASQTQKFLNTHISAVDFQNKILLHKNLYWSES